jgi:signal transduction histidine kinase
MSTVNYITRITKNIPIGKKLLLIVLLTTNIALLLASTAVVLYDRQSEKTGLSQELGILARVIGQRSTAALAFDDEQLATENLQTLSENKTIITACIYNADNNLFSEYHADNAHSSCQSRKPDINTGFTKDGYLIDQKITLDDSLVGFVFVKASLDEINKRLVNYIVFVGFMFVVASSLAFLLAIKLQKVITNPISDLADASRKIYDQKDYSIRVDKSTNDEVGHLVESFNDMLTGIEERDAALVDAKENLEGLVKERTRKLKEAQDELVRSERMATLGQLTATVSHELRNPLGTIRTSVFTLSNKLKDKNPDLINIIDRVERNIVRCDNIITELLDYSRIRALNHERTNLSTWIRSIISDMTIPDSIKLKMELNDEIDVEIDQGLLQRVVINIVENGYQAIDDHNSHENTLLIQSALSDSKTEIIVIDTGPGIPDDVYPHIFEPLYSTKGFGVGLGLPVVKQIMEQHGGGVDIVSEKNVGTKVTLWLPSSLTFSKEMVS